ncbi:MAG: hypothetical protein M1832_005615 [Thelocarpon impressellum]|nr:MAG: hypothetical protein M1832_005615 [Thelocarpon impressellum]
MVLSTAAPPPPQPAGSKKRKIRQATLYDAAAARVSTSGFIDSSAPRYASTRTTPTSSTLPLPPEEVLLRRKNAPERVEEADMYFEGAADVEGGLPDGELLKALHAYAADYYGRRGYGGDWRSLDETALLALGVLVEEMAGEVLGEAGDGVFVEGEEDEPVRGGSRGVSGIGEKVVLGSTRRGRKRRKNTT